MATLVHQMDQQASQIDQMHSLITKMTQYATALQMYVSLREIEKTTSQTAKYVEDLENGDHFSEKNLEVNILSALQSILQDVKSFGDININTICISSTLRLKTSRKDQAQHLVPKVPVIEQIKPSLLTRLTSTIDMKLNIWACLILPDASNGNNSIMVISPDGKTCKTILSEADGIKDPWQIDINRETGMMIVSSRMSDDDSVTDYETAFVYTI
ncbi:unnamed protein product [Mytilus edulis]|uniref:Uncharacterized protein n=1 Tax=Mytilus edulis TaxID=6550 RepID=A0A8S3VA20_MYTED|nr:unnamed protein product [Mytilus edulis]